jgi:ELWxxDGT repeat protein
VQRELWATDGSVGGTVLVADINPSGDSSPQNLLAAGKGFYFQATEPGTGVRHGSGDSASRSTSPAALLTAAMRCLIFGV